MRKLAKNTKALSPVIATIILVAVTVAIAIAVAAWLGALTFTYTNTEQVTITSAVPAASANTVVFGLSNSGTSDVVLGSGSVTGGTLTNIALTLAGGSATNTCTAVAGALGSVLKGQSCTMTLQTASGNFVAGTSYQFKLLSTKGNPFLTTTTA